MRLFQKLMTNAIIGGITGSILLLPYLGWLYSGHGIIEFDWTKRFLIVGIVWGVVCGITIGLVPTMIILSEFRRIMIGMIIGGLGGMIFYLIGDLAFLTDDSLLVILFKSLWGLGVGIISGGFCSLVLDKLNRSLKWIRIRDDSSDQGNQSLKRQFKKRFLSAIIGLNAGSFAGNFLLVFIGQAIIALFGTVNFYEIGLLYFLPLIFGCLTAIYLYIRPLNQQLLRNILDGLRNGIIFGLMFILYFAIVSLMVVQFSIAKPEYMTDYILVGFVSSVIVVFTALFGLIDGATAATFEGFFLEWKAKQKTT